MTYATKRTYGVTTPITTHSDDYYAEELQDALETHDAALADARSLVPDVMRFAEDHPDLVFRLGFTVAPSDRFTDRVFYQDLDSTSISSWWMRYELDDAGNKVQRCGDVYHLDYILARRGPLVERALQVIVAALYPLTAHAGPDRSNSPLFSSYFDADGNEKWGCARRVCVRRSRGSLPCPFTLVRSTGRFTSRPFTRLRTGPSLETCYNFGTSMKKCMI